MQEKEVKFEFYNEKLFEFRKNKNLSQEELAEKIGVSRQSIYAWESGKSVPDIENMSKLCQILEIKTSDLTNGVEIERNNTLKVKESNVKKIMKILKIIIGMIFIVYLIIFLRKLIILERLNYLQINFGIMIIIHILCFGKIQLVEMMGLKCHQEKK